MNKDQVRGHLGEAKGKLTEAVGGVTGKDATAARGKAEQITGKSQTTYGGAKKAFKKQPKPQCPRPTQACQYNAEAIVYKVITAAQRRESEPTACGYIPAVDEGHTYQSAMDTSLGMAFPANGLVSPGAAVYTKRQLNTSLDKTDWSLAVSSKRQLSCVEPAPRHKGKSRAH